MSWRTVVLPREHGGWSLIAEPALLGLLVAPSWAGVALALAGLVAFLARQPLRLFLVDRTATGGCPGRVRPPRSLPWSSR